MFALAHIVGKKWILRSFSVELFVLSLVNFFLRK